MSRSSVLAQVKPQQRKQQPQEKKQKKNVTLPQQRAGGPGGGGAGSPIVDYSGSPLNLDARCYVIEYKGLSSFDPDTAPPQAPVVFWNSPGNPNDRNFASPCDEYDLAIVFNDGATPPNRTVLYYSVPGGRPCVNSNPSKLVVFNPQTEEAKYTDVTTTTPQALSVAASTPPTYTIPNTHDITAVKKYRFGTETPAVFPTTILCGQCYIALAVYLGNGQWNIVYPLGMPGVRVYTNMESTVCGETTSITVPEPLPYDDFSEPYISTFPDMCFNTVLTECSGTGTNPFDTLDSFFQDLTSREGCWLPPYFLTQAAQAGFFAGTVGANPEARITEAVVCKCFREWTSADNMTPLDWILHVPQFTFRASSGELTQFDWNSQRKWSLQFKDCDVKTTCQVPDVTCSDPDNTNFFVRTYEIKRNWWAWSYAPETSLGKLKCIKRFLGTQTIRVSIYAKDYIILSAPCRPPEFTWTPGVIEPECAVCETEPNCCPTFNFNYPFCSHVTLFDFNTQWVAIGPLIVTPFTQGRLEASVLLKDGQGCSHTLSFIFDALTLVSAQNRQYAFSLIVSGTNTDGVSYSTVAMDEDDASFQVLPLSNTAGDIPQILLVLDDQGVDQDMSSILGTHPLASVGYVSLASACFTGTHSVIEITNQAQACVLYSLDFPFCGENGPTLEEFQQWSVIEVRAAGNGAPTTQLTLTLLDMNNCRHRMGIRHTGAFLPSETSTYTIENGRTYPVVLYTPTVLLDQDPTLVIQSGTEFVLSIQDSNELVGFTPRPVLSATFTLACYGESVTLTPCRRFSDAYPLCDSLSQFNNINIWTTQSFTFIPDPEDPSGSGSFELYLSDAFGCTHQFYGQATYTPSGVGSTINVSVTNGEILVDDATVPLPNTISFFTMVLDTTIRPLPAANDAITLFPVTNLYISIPCLDPVSPLEMTRDCRLPLSDTICDYISASVSSGIVATWTPFRLDWTEDSRTCLLLFKTPDGCVHSIAFAHEDTDELVPNSTLTVTTLGTIALDGKVLAPAGTQISIGLGNFETPLAFDATGFVHILEIQSILFQVSECGDVPFDLSIRTCTTLTDANLSAFCGTADLTQWRVTSLSIPSVAPSFTTLNQSTLGLTDPLGCPHTLHFYTPGVTLEYPRDTSVGGSYHVYRLPLTNNVGEPTNTIVLDTMTIHLLENWLALWISTDLSSSNNISIPAVGQVRIGLDRPAMGCASSFSEFALVHNSSLTAPIETCMPLFTGQLCTTDISQWKVWYVTVKPFTFNPHEILTFTLISPDNCLHYLHIGWALSSPLPELRHIGPDTVVGDDPPITYQTFALINGESGATPGAYAWMDLDTGIGFENINASHFLAFTAAGGFNFSVAESTYEVGFVQFQTICGEGPPVTSLLSSSSITPNKWSDAFNPLCRFSPDLSTWQVTNLTMVPTGTFALQNWTMTVIDADLYTHFLSLTSDWVDHSLTGDLKLYTLHTVSGKIDDSVITTNSETVQINVVADNGMGTDVLNSTGISLVASDLVSIIMSNVCDSGAPVTILSSEPPPARKGVEAKRFKPQIKFQPRASAAATKRVVKSSVVAKKK